MEGLKRLWLIVGGIIIFIGILIFLIIPIWHKISCSPNSHDVKVMKPQAKAITDYIVKNGMPKSLKNIPELPYGLMECFSQQHNLEGCTFYKNNRKYEVELYVLGYIYLEIYSPSTHTGIKYKLKDSNSDAHWYIVQKNVLFSSKSTGICKKFGRQ